MKLNEQYKLLKREYPKYIILLKSGMFFVTYTEDAYILNYLLSYQINDEKLGFPIKSLEKVLNTIKKYEINIYVVSEEIKKFEYQNNNYQEILKSAKKDYYQELSSKVLLEEIAYLLKSDPQNIDKIRGFIHEL